MTRSLLKYMMPEAESSRRPSTRRQHDTHDLDFLAFWHRSVGYSRGAFVLQAQNASQDGADARRPDLSSLRGVRRGPWHPGGGQGHATLRGALTSEMAEKTCTYYLSQ